MVGSSRCYSIPKTECQLTYNIANRKKRIVYAFQFLILIGIGITCWYYFRPKTIYFSPFYDVERKDNGDIIMTPLSGTPHISTIIFLHDYGHTNDNIFEFFANKNS